MTYLNLIHPKHGKVNSYMISGQYNTERIIQMFKWRYGKKFYECTIEIETI